MQRLTFFNASKNENTLIVPRQTISYQTCSLEEQSDVYSKNAMNLMPPKTKLKSKKV